MNDQTDQKKKRALEEPLQTDDSDSLQEEENSASATGSGRRSLGPRPLSRAR